MTSTFKLTGRILDKNKQPVARAGLSLRGNIPALADGVADEVYTWTPRITTDDDGYLCVADDQGVPAPSPGVDLVVGVQYTLKSTNRALMNTLVFTAPAAGTTLNIADIIPEPPASDPTWSDRVENLDERVYILEQGGGGGGAVASVNGEVGIVVLDAADVGADPAGSADAVATDLADNLVAHANDTTNVHGIANTANLETTSGAQSKADAAQAAAVQRNNHTGTQTSATISDFTEAAQDAIAALLASGTQISLSYNDAGNALTVSATGADAETMRDTIGAALAGVGNIAVTVNDALDTITISTTATVNSTDAALRDRSSHTGTQAHTTITGLGTAATVNTGTASGDIPLLSTGGRLPIARLASGTPDGTKFVRDDGTLAAAGGGGGLPNGRGKSASTTFLSLQGLTSTGNTTTTTMSNNRACYQPRRFTTAVTVDQVTVECTTAVASCNGRFALYAANNDWQPTGAPLFDSGNVDFSTTGIKNVSLGSVAVPAGNYVVWCNFSTGNPNVRVVTVVSSLVGYSPTTIGSQIQFMYAAQAFGAPPSTPLAWDQVALSGAAQEWIFLRESVA